MLEKQAEQEQKIIEALTIEIGVMKSKKDTLKTEMENDKKIQAEMNESNESMAQSLKDI